MTETSKTPLILIADDEARNIKLLTALCKKMKYRTISAGSGNEAIEKAIQHQPDVILMDIMMPEMNGFEATDELKQNKFTKHVPIIIVSALDSRDDRLMGISKGADDFLTKPIDPEEMILKLKNNLKIKQYHDLLEDHNKSLEQHVKERTWTLKKAFLELDKTYKNIKVSYRETIYRLTLAAEFKDEDTGEHIKRVSFYTKILAQEMGLDSEFVENIFHSSPMHDIGKVGIPDSTLFKPGPHTTYEWEIMKKHTEIGAKILGGSESPFLKMAEEIALTHHERWDGTGYPHGLKGDDIALSGRIMNIADQYDALRSKRPYKPAFDHYKATKIITSGDDRTMPGHFDPQVLNAFKKLADDFNTIYEENQNSERVGSGRELLQMI
jgi:putative two-component system response regulator